MATGQLVTQGSPHRYVTGTNFSQVSMTFKMPANSKTRTIFERWLSFARNDADQYVDYYDNYCAPTVRIFKWERGGGKNFSIWGNDAWSANVNKLSYNQGWLGTPAEVSHKKSFLSIDNIFVLIRYSYAMMLAPGPQWRLVGI